MTYLDELAALIRSCLPAEAEPPAGAEDLFRLYAVLLKAKGPEVTEEDVHDAWSAWAQQTDPGHGALVPFAELDASAQALDTPYVHAIRQAHARWTGAVEYGM
ncbi:hypothetical protein ACFU5N_10520 [Streptomyces albidoflavus]